MELVHASACAFVCTLIFMIVRVIVLVIACTIVWTIFLVSPGFEPLALQHDLFCGSRVRTLALAARSFCGSRVQFPGPDLLF